MGESITYLFLYSSFLKKSSFINAGIICAIRFLNPDKKFYSAR